MGSEDVKWNQMTSDTVHGQGQPSDSVKAWEFLGELSDYQLFKDSALRSLLLSVTTRA
jgi:hypothetical protein